MDFEYTPKVKQMQARLLAFMEEHIYPNEARYLQEIEANRAKGNAWVPSQVIEELKPKARAAGLWNLFIPKSKRAPEGLSNLEYAPLSRSWVACHGLLKSSIARPRTPATWKRSSAMPAKRSRTAGWSLCCAVKSAQPS